MATKVITELLDDIDGTEAAETVRFGLNGTSYEIDLSAANVKKLHAALAPFVENGRRTASDRRVSVTPSGKRARGSRPDMAQIREWARSQGHNLGDKGRIPAKIVEAYDAR